MARTDTQIFFFPLSQDRVFSRSFRAIKYSVGILTQTMHAGTIKYQ